MIIRTLKCQLTKAERETKKEELARLLDERDALQSSFDLLKSKHKASVAEFDSAIKTMRDSVRTNSEDRPIECEERHDERRGQIDIVRTDTLETIESRPMTVEERQGTLFDDPKGERN
jgi:hypothetical protein